MAVPSPTRNFVFMIFLFHVCRFLNIFSVFNSCDVLKPYVAHLDDIFKDFTSYKVRVPVTGAIILDETYERVRFTLNKLGCQILNPHLSRNYFIYIFCPFDVLIFLESGYL